METPSRSESNPDVRIRIDVDAVDETYLMRVRLHHERSRPDSVTEEADASHQRAVRDARGREDNPLAGRKLLRPVHLLEVGDAHGAAPLLVLGLADDESRENFAVETPHRRSGQPALRRTAGAHHRMHAAANHGGSDTGRQVAVTDQANAGACRADISNQLLVSRAV